MGKQEKRDKMSQVYRQFSRQKYNKYKHQFPKMRESQIVSKIIREWDSLDFEAKQKLQKQYEQNRFLSTEDRSQSQSCKKSSQNVKLQNVKLQRKEEKDSCLDTPIVKKQNEEQSNQCKIKLQPTTTAKKNTLSVSNVLINPNSFKRLDRTNNNEYIAFFKHYYAVYSKQHPNWQAKQITLIIKLLWRKRKNQSKKNISLKTKTTNSQRKKKILSGRNYFRKLKGLSGQDSLNIWKRMPLETRKRWESQAKGAKLGIEKQTKVVLKSSEGQSKLFNFLSKSMR